MTTQHTTLKVWLVLVVVFVLGSFTGGALASNLGLRPTLWIAAAGGLFAFLPPLFSPVRTLRRIPAREEEPPAETAGGGTGRSRRRHAGQGSATG